MSNVIGLKDFVGMDNSDCPNCWLCQKAVSTRALFCHHCGTVQPVRDIDCYARLGLERRFDVDLAHMERQYAALTRTLDPTRFLIRGLGERGHAAKQMEALTDAYETLRDPLRRCRYWLQLNTSGDDARTDRAVPNAGRLRQDMDDAAAACDCDRVAQQAGQMMQECLLGLMQALRAENWDHAWDNLAEIDYIESVLGDIRTRRTDITTSVK